MPYQYYENQYLEGQIMQNRSQIAENQFAQGYVQQPTQVRQGQVNNYVNNTASVGTAQAVENVNYYDTYHHRINNYHTMNTNRYRDHYVDHNVYYNSSRNVYDGADYHTTSNYVVDPVYASTGLSTGGVVSGSTGTIGSTGTTGSTGCGCNRPQPPCWSPCQGGSTGSTGCGCGCNRPQPRCWSPCQGGSTGNTASYRRFPGQSY